MQKSGICGIKRVSRLRVNRNREPQPVNKAFSMHEYVFYNGRAGLIAWERPTYTNSMIGYFLAFINRKRVYLWKLLPASRTQ